MNVYIDQRVIYYRKLPTSATLTFPLSKALVLVAESSRKMLTTTRLVSDFCVWVLTSRIEDWSCCQIAPAAAAATTTAATPAAYAPQSATGDAFTDIPTTNMRRIIGSRLTESKQTVPHYYVTVEVDMDKISKLREVLNKSSEGKYKLSVNDFIVKASALSLKKVPEVNAAWQGDFIRQ